MGQRSSADVISSGGPSRGDAARRSLIKAGILGSLFAPFVRPALAAPSPDGRPDATSGAPSPQDSGPAAAHLTNAGDMLNGFAITQVIMRERLAREMHDFDAEDACFLPDARVEVSWFKGTAREFTASAKKVAASGRHGDLSFDSMSPAVVTINRDRALADTSCAIHSIVTLDGVEAIVTSYTRLLWQARKMDGDWRIAGLHAVYFRDTLEPTDPSAIPKIDAARLGRYRPSYRHLSYLHEATGRAMRNDLPGVDQPETVTALRASNQAWLTQASSG